MVPVGGWVDSTDGHEYSSTHYGRQHLFNTYNLTIKLSMTDVWKYLDKINAVNEQCKLCNVKLKH